MIRPVSGFFLGLDRLDLGGLKETLLGVPACPRGLERGVVEPGPVRRRGGVAGGFCARESLKDVLGVSSGGIVVAWVDGGVPLSSSFGLKTTQMKPVSLPLEHSCLKAIISQN